MSSNALLQTIDTLTQDVVQRDLTIKALRLTIEKLKIELTHLKRMRYGRSSEKMEAVYILNQAKDIGAHAHRLCEVLFGIEGRVGQRKLWGIVGLGRTYPRRLVNSACERALLDGIHSYKHVKALTERLVADALAAIDSAPETPLAQAELCLTQKHDLIRSPDEYADLFARCSTQS